MIQVVENLLISTRPWFKPQCCQKKGNHLIELFLYILSTCMK
jgi:hypothetical protein